jgi:prepilin-type N-terminal cleavage/methylation domain-containing protein
MHQSARRRNSRGFTLLEIASVIVVILILITLLVPTFEQVRMRTDKAACMNNLRQLYVAATSYMEEYKRWPQVNPSLLQEGGRQYEDAWIEAFLPFGINRNSWICPTTERDLGGPDYTQPNNYRADYIAMPFDGKQITPYRWPFDPWFVERGNVHGNGNLMIQANGAVVELSQMQAALHPNASPGPH